MNQFKENNQNPVDQEIKNDQSPVQSNFGVKPKPKPSMSKREIMEELSRQRFPWEE